MSDADKLPWFPCEPGPLLGTLAGMPPDDQIVYIIVLLRIYEDGGPCLDTLDALARRTGLNKRRVSESLNNLFKANRLHRDGDGLMNPKASKILSDRATMRAGLSKAGTRGAARRWQKPLSDQTPTNGAAKATPLAIDGDLQLQLDSSPRSEEH